MSDLPGLPIPVRTDCRILPGHFAVQPPGEPPWQHVLHVCSAADPCDARRRQPVCVSCLTADGDVTRDGVAIDPDTGLCLHCQPCPRCGRMGTGCDDDARTCDPPDPT